MFQNANALFPWPSYNLGAVLMRWGVFACAIGAVTTGGGGGSAGGGAAGGPGAGG